MPTGFVIDSFGECGVCIFSFVGHGSRLFHRLKQQRLCPPGLRYGDRNRLPIAAEIREFVLTWQEKLDSGWIAAGFNAIPARVYTPANSYSLETKQECISACTKGRLFSKWIGVFKGVQVDSG